MALSRAGAQETGPQGPVSDAVHSPPGDALPRPE